MSSRANTLNAVRSSVTSISPETKQLVFVVLASVAVMSPILIWGMPSSCDLSNHFRFALPFYDSIRAGHFYPGWLAESNSGYGDASFRFYPPALYYLLAFARTVTGNWLAATIVTANLLSVLGGLGVYLWAREVGCGRFAVWAGILFGVAPYHLNQFFQSFMLAEYAGTVVLAFAFLFIERVCCQRRPRDMAGLAAAYGLLILTHLPLAVIGSIALLIYALFRLDSGKRLATFACLSLSMGLGLLASASYWTTMLLELNWIRADNVMPDPSVDYRANFVLATFSPDYLNVWWMNILLLVTAAMFWPALVLLWRSARNSAPTHSQNRKSLQALFAVFILAIVMATPVSRPLWDALKPLQQTQFPWRWFAIISLVCPILLAMAIPYWRQMSTERHRSLVILAAGTAAIAFAFSASHIIREAYWLTPQQFENTIAEIPGSPSVSQWLPVWVHEPNRNMASPVEAGDRKVTIDSWQPERRVFQVSAGQATTARVRTFYYPHWVATAEDQKLAVSHDEDGAIRIALPPGSGRVTLEFQEPPRVTYAAILTLAGWLLIVLLLVGRSSLRWLPLKSQN
jgi:6-pyruvoyl-tetrahydropterin synthase related domain